MTSQEHADAIQKNEDNVFSLHSLEIKLREDWVKYHCPINIGDIVEGNDYSFRGKKMVVEEIDITDHMVAGVGFRVKWKWIATGPVLNKDGTPGKNYTRYAVAVADVKWEV